jgi:hypothetical protein
MSDDMIGLVNAAPYIRFRLEVHIFDKMYRYVDHSSCLRAKHTFDTAKRILSDIQDHTILFGEEINEKNQSKEDVQP